jgi:pyruvate ferredoxin oxidoreductase alpha subunit
VRLPVIVNLDGFYLSFTREPVEVPAQADVDAFLPAFECRDIQFRASQPESQAVAVLGGGPYSYFRYQTHLAALNGTTVYAELGAEHGERLGRAYDPVECWRSEDAEVCFVMIGSFATKAKAAVDALRDAGQSVGLVRPRLLRPFPAAALRQALAGKRAVAVIDQNLSFGFGGVLHGELCSALYGLPRAPVLASFVGGLGGRDIALEELVEIARVTAEAGERGTAPPPRLLYTADELREVRKLQTLAHAERQLGHELEHERARRPAGPPQPEQQSQAAGGPPEEAS